MFYNLRRKITTIFLLVMLGSSALWGSVSKEHNLTDVQLHAVLGIITSFILDDSSVPDDSSDTPDPKVAALTKIESYAKSDGNTTSLTLQDYLDAGVVVETRLIGALNMAVADMATADLNSTTLQQMVETLKATPPVLTLIGDANVTVEAGEAHRDKGATAMDALDGNLTAKITTSVSSVDINILGSYTITYSVTDEDNNTATVERNVTIVDTTPPTITLLGDNPQTLEFGTAYIEQNATASDNYDGNLTSVIMVDSTAVNVSQLGEYSVTYNVADSSGNSAVEMVRTITIADTTPPLFTSDPNATVAENQTSAITLVATDATAVTYSIDVAGSENFDINASTGVVTFKASPDFETLALYSFTATATDSSGNEATQEVTIEIADTEEESTSTTLLKKTGQTTSYYAGDDGDLQMGVTPSYSRANEVVTDEVTKLQWQDNAEAKTVTKTWDEAKSYCSALGLDGGGWRLPTIQELQSIVVDGAYNPSIDTTAFVNYTTSHYYWSSTTYAHYTDDAWLVYFGNGGTSNDDKSRTCYVRCVR